MKNSEPFVSLTKRELEVFNLMARGLNNNAIALRLSITSHTAKSHVASILKKLNAKDRLLAVIIGIKKGILKINDIDV